MLRAHKSRLIHMLCKKDYDTVQYFTDNSTQSCRTSSDVEDSPCTLSTRAFNKFAALAAKVAPFATSPSTTAITACSNKARIFPASSSILPMLASTDTILSARLAPFARTFSASRLIAFRACSTDVDGSKKSASYSASVWKAVRRVVEIKASASFSYVCASVSARRA
ncbi:hypothetical protein M378DRAFT_337305 [Amanita muscaria Koide BX008]|uniref:Uncharacterized protein n=1 Tax=Amanita muscaria (strain Koide BX008) TaxID=946122 RepID=A0A0C2WAE0_AMAMK|nr:hypothetical protein M378DRAFT_337305 [Amanita muscaria Koide BX008]